MRMEINGRKSFTGKSRHINIIYFFINDMVDKGGLGIVCFLTHLILVDYFTKPLQRSLFCKFMDIIMGRFSPYTLLKDIASY